MSKKGLKGCHEMRRGSRGIERKLGKFYYDLGISDCFMFAFHRLSRTGEPFWAWSLPHSTPPVALWLRTRGYSAVRSMFRVSSSPHPEHPHQIIDTRTHSLSLFLSIPLGAVCHHHTGSTQRAETHQFPLPSIL
jgi:hypothetical protein